MELIYSGKTKNVYRLQSGNNLLEFKDTATGKNGIYDPGENQIGLTIEGLGSLNLRTTNFFFDLLEKNGILTHRVRTDFESNSMEVLPVLFFGKGVEVICRLRATGSFLRRYGEYVNNGELLSEPYVEVTLKDDLRGDPLINQDALRILDIMQEAVYVSIKHNAVKITSILEAIMRERGLLLWDIKYEFGIYKNKVILIDEISSGNMRVSKNGEFLDPISLNLMFVK